MLTTKAEKCGTRFAFCLIAHQWPKGKGMQRKHLLVVAALMVALFAPRDIAFSQDFASSQDKPSTPAGKSVQSDGDGAQLDQDIKLLRKDLRSEKKQIVAANMDMTDATAQKFWPVYDQYAADLAKIGDTKAALIKNYLQTSDKMSGEQAVSYVQNRAEVEQSIMKLRLKYLPIFQKVLSGRQTALFFQIDWRLGLLTDLQLAQMPLIDP
jgi:hypothetical protein